MSSEFDFFQQWYPVSPVEDLKRDRPTPIKLLGQNFVIWQPGNPSGNPAELETFIALRDECPHRLAPLSEGRIDEKTGNLMCSYHGWQFDPAGECQKIPQLENPERLTNNAANFCVTAFPCRVANGLVWVWPDAHSKDVADETELPLSPQIDAEKGFVWSSMVRDLAYDWQTLVENVADPSHVPFAHHGVQGDRNYARPMKMEILTSTSDLIDVDAQGNVKSRITFQPPCRLEYAIDFGDGRKVGLVTYCLPTEPGRSRIVAQFPRNFDRQKLRLTPRWFEHLTLRNNVLDGDMVLLHQQEKLLQQRSESWKTAYKMPAGSDRMVIEFRNWFDRHGKSTYPWPEIPTEGVSREVALDRYHQHTEICGSCRGALRQIQRLQLVLVGVFAIAIASASLVPDSSRLICGGPLVLVGLLSLAGAAWLKRWLEPQFYFVDYVHAER